jgi:hypothetical protein
VDLLVAGIAVAAFAAVVLVLTGAGRRLERLPVRTAVDPEGEEWMRVEEVAERLRVVPADVAVLADRDAIPHFVIAGGIRTRPTDLRFRRDEIDAWTIG